MAVVRQKPPKLDLEFIAGNPFGISVTSTGATVTAPVVHMTTGGGTAYTTDPGVPTATQASSVTTVAFSTTDTAALNATVRKKDYLWSLQALVDGAGPYEIVAGLITVHPVGSSAATSTATSLNLALTVDGVNVALEVDLGGGNMAAADILTAIKTVDGTGSGLDADTVDGLHAASFQLAGATAGGVLGGTYPNPSFAADMATQAELNAAIAALNYLNAAGIYDIRAYGATVGGDPFDNAAAYIAADQAAKTAGGGVVYGPPGLFEVSWSGSDIVGGDRAIILQSGNELHLAKGHTIFLADNQVSPSAGGAAIIGNKNGFLGSSWPIQPDHDITISGFGVIDGNSAGQTTVPTYGGTTAFGGTDTLVNSGVRFDTVLRPKMVGGITVKNIRGWAAGGTFSGSSPATLAESFAVSSYRCADVDISGVNVFSDDGGPTASGIGATYTAVYRISDCSVHDLMFGVGFAEWDSANIVANNLHSYRNGANGFLNEHSRDVFRYGCISGGRAQDTDTLSNTISVYPDDDGYAVKFLGNPTSGTWTLSINGEAASALAIGATLAQIKAAVEATSAVGAGECTVTAGIPTGEFTTQSNWDILLTGTSAGKVITLANTFVGGTARIRLHQSLGNVSMGWGVDSCGGAMVWSGGALSYNGGQADDGEAGVISYGTHDADIMIRVTGGAVIERNWSAYKTAFGDGAAASILRARQMHIDDTVIIGPNKGPTGTGTEKVYTSSSGDSTATDGTINGFLITALMPLAGTGVAVANPFPHGITVRFSGGTVTALTVTPGGRVPSAAYAIPPQAGSFYVPHGGSFTPTYSVAPTVTVQRGNQVSGGLSFDFTTIGKSLATAANVAAGQTALSLVPGTNVQAYSAVLAATTASFLSADRTKLDGIETAATADMTAAEILTAIKTVDGTGSGLDADLLDGLSSADFATAAQGTLAGTALQPAAIGTTVQGYDVDLAQIAALTSAANKVPYSTGAGTWALADLTVVARTLLDDATTAALRTTLGLDTALPCNQDLPVNAISQTFTRGCPTVALGISTGIEYLVRIHLFAGQVVSKIAFKTSAAGAASSPTNQWFSLRSSARVLLGITSDDLTTPWGNATVKELTLASPYSVLADGDFYLGLMVKGSATSVSLDAQVGQASLNGIAPIKCGTDATNTGLTTPGTAPGTSAALTASTGFAYAYVS